MIFHATWRRFRHTAKHWLGRIIVIITRSLSLRQRNVNVQKKNVQWNEKAKAKLVKEKGRRAWSHCYGCVIASPWKMLSNLQLTALGPFGVK